MTRTLALLLLVSLAICDKVELEYTATSMVFACKSNEYKTQLQPTITQLKSLANFDDTSINSFVVGNLKVKSGDNTGTSVQPLPTWKVEINAKKGNDSTKMKADCACYILNSMAQLLCNAENRSTQYDSFSLLPTDNENIKITISAANENSASNLSRKYLMMIMALFLII